MDILALYAHYLAHPSVCTDTRKIGQGDLFFALKGGNFNGNEFAAKALEDGAAMAFVDEEAYVKDERYILVPDVLKALQALAAHHRDQLDIPVIGITGSNGKTTTKELMRDVLAQQYTVSATIGNLNNHIGVPLTLLRIRPQHQIAIVEMGANHLEEIAFLCTLCKPTHGMVTNFGRAHIGEFGGWDNIVMAKSELYDYLRKNDAVAFVNGDDMLSMEKAVDIDLITYGAGALLDFQGRIVEESDFLTLEVKPDDQRISTQLIGDYNFSNVLAALCIGDHFQVPLTKMMQAITSYAPENNRSQLVKRNDNRIILDAYNANPTSMEAALRSQSQMAGEIKAAIIGDMKELGAESPKAHLEIAQLTQELEIKAVFVGPEFEIALANGDWKTFPDTAAYCDNMGDEVAADLILIKGSRSIGLEKVMEHI